MSDQNSLHPTTRRKSRQGRKENGTQIPEVQHPTTDDQEVWKAYWKRQKQPWRTEPEISPQRQEELQQRRTLVPDIDQGLYPFRGMHLSCADVEWPLVTHQDGQGPVYWTGVHAQKQEGLDLRGTDLCQADLRGLPLACLRGGLTLEEAFSVAKEQRILAEEDAAVLLEGAHLEEAHLEGAYLRGAQLTDASLLRAHLEEADLS